MMVYVSTVRPALLRKEASMAGTFTHWMVVDQALDRYAHLPQTHPFFPVILNLNHFVCLGAVGPDYPYLTDLLDNYLKIHSWADRMHYEKTGDFARFGAKNLLPLNGDSFNTCLAWLCGYVSHLVTDAVIHPVVQAVVGPYIFNADEHRHCEMTQDTYIFREIKGVELRYGDYASLFKMCSDPVDPNKISPYVREFWIPTLQADHPTAAPWFGRIDPDRWHKNVLSRISSASSPTPIFRHIGEKEDLVYKTTKELTPDERTRFIDTVKLPANKTGQFKKDAFDKAVATVIEVWKRLFVDISNKNPDGSAAYILNCDLDTGVDEDKQVYWS
jgi:Zinc dependent phospholipase C